MRTTIVLAPHYSPAAVPEDHGKQRGRREGNQARRPVRGEGTLTRPLWPQTPARRLPGLPAPRWSRGGTMSGPGPARHPAPPSHTARTDPGIAPRYGPDFQKPRCPPRRQAAAVTQAGTEGSDPGQRTALAPTGLEARIAAEAQAPPPAGQPARPRPLLAKQALPTAGPPAGPAPGPSAGQAPPPTCRHAPIQLV